MTGSQVLTAGIEFSELQSDVVNLGLCSGCGGCTYQQPEVRMTLTEYGTYIPTSENPSASIKACPFHNHFDNEDQISEKVFTSNTKYEKHIGSYINTYAGYITDMNFRKTGSSGGLTTWLAKELLRAGLVDGIVHVKSVKNADSEILFEHSISTTAAELESNKKSRYYPTTLESALKRIEKEGGRYALIGVPCFIKAVRQLSQSDPGLNEKIVFTIGIVCGHLKSTAFSELISWQLLGEQKRPDVLDFRTKLKYRPANSYGVTVTAGDKEVVKPMVDVDAGDWGEGHFKLKACDFCDDVLAETADVVFGDAWLPRYKNDPYGTNIVVTRNKVIDDLIANGRDSNAIYLEDVTKEDIVQSQRSGIIHRSEGLQYRLGRAENQNLKMIKKRVSEEYRISDSRKRTYDLRESIRDMSHRIFFVAKRENSRAIYLEGMGGVVNVYHKRSRSERFINRVKRNGIRVVRKMFFKYSEKV